ncbi:MAG: PTS IIA-like nitrogen regulatory protein PtsN [Nevskiales bacterium]|nr:PTS IIA-like nitrogen regulatory protein PtsN [Nevskiales bacterium]
MKLSAILSADRVVSGIAVTSKKKVLEELSKRLAQGTKGVSAQDIFNGLAAREKLGSTGLGHGVAIPHGRLPGVHNSVGAFLRLQHPVDYDSHDGQAVDLVFGLVVPTSATEEHLKHLAAIAEKFSDEGFCQRVRAVQDSGTLYALLVQ